MNVGFAIGENNIHKVLAGWPPSLCPVINALSFAPIICLADEPFITVLKLIKIICTGFVPDKYLLFPVQPIHRLRNNANVQRTVVGRQHSRLDLDFCAIGAHGGARVVGGSGYLAWFGLPCFNVHGRNAACGQLPCGIYRARSHQPPGTVPPCNRVWPAFQYGMGCIAALRSLPQTFGGTQRYDSLPAHLGVKPGRCIRTCIE